MVDGSVVWCTTIRRDMTGKLDGRSRVNGNICFFCFFLNLPRTPGGAALQEAARWLSDHSRFILVISCIFCLCVCIHASIGEKKSPAPNGDMLCNEILYQKWSTRNAKGTRQARQRGNYLGRRWEKMGTKHWALEVTTKRYHGDRLNWRIANLAPLYKERGYISKITEKTDRHTLHNHLTRSTRRFHPQ